MELFESGLEWRHEEISRGNDLVEKQYILLNGSLSEYTVFFKIIVYFFVARLAKSHLFRAADSDPYQSLAADELCAVGSVLELKQGAQVRADFKQ